MFTKLWNVLVVDDEPDVLAVTRLALKRMSCYGVPVKLFEAKSKAEALEFLNTSQEAERLALAIVDVVMDGDQAGLELCSHIRNEMKNKVTRLVIRTGQAGYAPEREVVDRYDISSYLAKTEATDEKLYSVVKCSIREYFPALVQQNTGRITRALINSTESPEKFKGAVERLLGRIGHDAKGRAYECNELNHGWIFGEGASAQAMGTGVFSDPAKCQSVMTALKNAPGTPLNEEGDTLHYADGQAMIALTPRGTLPAVHALGTPAVWPAPDFSVDAMHAMVQAARPLWTIANRK
jgi:CheY-like chemotaxis protein